ncbi:hypothetical protein [Deinococcus sonorensis]|uniref:Glycoside hydrolase family 2 catalytic domain-containing protein n=1 Tax=Deinococcus sonorensis KR-87 TaxID=694439 RepID=A0AAU7UCH1_9DEIO
MDHVPFPRPQLERMHWQHLNGHWDFAYDDQQQWRTPQEVTFDRQILVPYAPESPASGIHDTGFHSTLWYRRRRHSGA